MRQSVGSCVKESLHASLALMPRQRRNLLMCVDKTLHELFLHAIRGGGVMSCVVVDNVCAVLILWVLVTKINAHHHKPQNTPLFHLCAMRAIACFENLQPASGKNSPYLNYFA